VISIATALLVGALCVLVQGFFSGSEICFVSADRARLRKRAADGDIGARLAEGFLENPQILLATTLVGTNLCLLVFSVTVALSLLGRDLGSSELLAIGIVTPMTLVFGEVVPKTLCQRYSDRLVTRLVYPLRVASVFLRPLVWALAGVATVATRLVGSDENRAFVTRDELVLLIGADANLPSEITKDEREMISNVLGFSEAEVVDVMVPLSEVTALPETTSLAEAITEVADKRHSRMPVYEGRVDNVVGILHAFDLLATHRQGEAKVARDICRPASFVTENKPVADLLLELQGTGNQMAIVVDEYGGAVGIVTVEDILEEVVGEIEDEHDAGPAPVRQERPGVWRALAKTSVARINDELGLGLPEGEEYESLGGLIIDRLKKIPDQGASVIVDGITLRVVKSSARAIEEVQILRRTR